MPKAPARGHVVSRSARMHAEARTLPISEEVIPAEMRDRRQWVLWKYVERDGRSTKVPFQTSGRQAASDRPKTWTDFGTATAAYRKGGYEGIGYVFAGDDDFYGVDLDACRNPDTGELTPWAREIVVALDTYTEVSPSGYGVKAVARAQCLKGHAT